MAVADYRNTYRLHSYIRIPRSSTHALIHQTLPQVTSCHPGAGDIHNSLALHLTYVLSKAHTTICPKRTTDRFACKRSPLSHNMKYPLPSGSEASYDPRMQSRGDEGHGRTTLSRMDQVNLSVYLLSCPPSSAGQRMDASTQSTCLRAVLCLSSEGLFVQS